jgi:hypothetical protein
MIRVLSYIFFYYYKLHPYLLETLHILLNLYPSLFHKYPLLSDRKTEPIQHFPDYYESLQYY